MRNYTQYRTFFSFLILILLSTSIVASLYAYTVNTSFNIVREDIQSNNLNRLRFIIDSLDHNIEQLTLLAVSLEADSKVGLLPAIDVMDSYDKVQLIKDLTDKVNLQSFSEGWDNQISIYSSVIDSWIGSSNIQPSPPPSICKKQSMEYGT